jgi:hypothetical protein
MYNTTGFTRDEINDICARIGAVEIDPETSWPTILGLFNSVVVALTYMRRNRVQAEIAETFGVSQPTISRAVTVITPLVKTALAEFVPTADELDPGAQYTIDGTLLPCWSWAAHPELYSGKHKTTGMNVQVASTITGDLSWISDAINGSRHDSHCLGESVVLLTCDPGNWIGDKGYVGNDMITPYKKPSGGELLDWQKNLTLRSTRSDTSSSRSSQTSRPGGSCTPTTGGRSQRSPPLFHRSLPCTSTRSPE